MSDLIAPNHLSLGEVIARLEREPAEKVLPVGFDAPHAYRGYYHDLAFEVCTNVTVGAVLAAARSALGATFQGWKGGDYTMSDYSTCWLVTEEGDCGESLGAMLLELLIAGASVEALLPSDSADVEPIPAAGEVSA